MSSRGINLFGMAVLVSSLVACGSLSERDKNTAAGAAMFAAVWPTR